MTMQDDTRLSVSDLMGSIEGLRRAEAQLSRRLAAAHAPNDTDRTALRFIADAPVDAPITPRDLATHLQISTAAVTSVIRRLQERGHVVVAPHPTDARSKVLRSSLRDLNSPADELSVRIEAVASELGDADTAAVSRFLRRLAHELDQIS